MMPARWTFGPGRARATASWCGHAPSVGAGHQPGLARTGRRHRGLPRSTAPVPREPEVISAVRLIPQDELDRCRELSEALEMRRAVRLASANRRTCRYRRAH